MIYNDYRILYFSCKKVPWKKAQSNHTKVRLQVLDKMLNLLLKNPEFTAENFTFCEVFIQTEYGDLQSKSPYSFQM